MSRSNSFPASTHTDSFKARDAAAAKIKKEAMTAMKRGRDEDDDEEHDDEEDDVAFVAKRSKKTRRLPGKGDRVVELD